MRALWRYGELDRDPEAQAIPTVIIALAHQLGLRVVAEGVETASQELFLRNHGCDELQGFGLSRPIPAEELIMLLEQDSLHVASTACPQTLPSR